MLPLLKAFVGKTAVVNQKSAKTSRVAFVAYGVNILYRVQSLGFNLCTKVIYVLVKFVASSVNSLAS